MIYGDRYIPDQIRLTGKPPAARQSAESAPRPKPPLADILAWKQRHDAGESFRAISLDTIYSEKVIYARVRHLEAGAYNERLKEV